ncbi:MAG: hypothetical protein AB7P12_05295 [Alphaproteobacteria bacterium]
MRVHVFRAAIIAAVPTFVTALPATAQNANTHAGDITAIRQELTQMRQMYEKRIEALESQLKSLENTQAKKAQAAAPSAGGGRSVRDNSFNPSIGVILNGKLSTFSAESSEFAGFAAGEEGERGRKGLGIDESELNFSASVDDKFAGSLTAAIVREEGEDKVELEEAFVQTLPGAGLPDGTRIKAGRALWTFGYLNELHTHADDFADRPLPYRAFLNNHFNDDGLEFAWVLPTDFYAEIGGGGFRGDDFPFGSSSDGIGAWSAYARVGGDIGANQSWRVGAYMLSGTTEGRATNEDAVNFIGDSRLYAADLRYVWAPTGNNRDSEVILQGEYFLRKEKGTYEDTDAGTGAVAFNDDTSGWYLQGVYKFAPKWRAGLRYSRLDAADAPAGLADSALDSAGHDPEAFAVMLDWSHSEFSRLRLQYNYEELSADNPDHQFLLQYIMSIGAHGAHPF